jgi:hypothetical protein
VKTVYKYPLRLADAQAVQLPKGARILTAQFQGEQLCLWAMVDTDQDEMQKREIRIHGTGHPISNVDALRYIGTVQQFGGSLIWHVFLVMTDNEILMDALIGL